MNSTFCTPKKIGPSAPTAAASVLFEHHLVLNQGTPFGSSSTSSANSFRTPGSVKRTGRFHLLPMNRTPISRLNRVIVNPFEASLNERLHLPMICSPSLFHRPATPQMSSTQFEWTIEDVASLGPANVEADETQFIVQTDPELEARAQEAITSYFRDNVVLPSPINCPLREATAKMKLLPGENTLSEEELELGKSASKKRKTRDGVCQTVLTFPPILPKAIEDLLANFCTYSQDQQQCETDQYGLNDSSNASLRRKLFETSLNSDDLGVSKHETDDDHRHFEELHQRQLLKEVLPMGTPELKLEVKTRTRHFGSPTDNHLELSETKKESFGSLSPILNSTVSTGSSSTPAHVIAVDAKMHRHHSSSTSSLYRSTPERLSQRSVSISSVEMSSVHGSALKGGGSAAAAASRFCFEGGECLLCYRFIYRISFHFIVLDKLAYLDLYFCSCPNPSIWLHLLPVDRRQLVLGNAVEEE